MQYIYIKKLNFLSILTTIYIEESLKLQPKLFEELRPDNVIDKLIDVTEIIQKNQLKYNQ